MQATVSGRPASSTRRSSVSGTVLPHRWLASRSSAWPSERGRVTGAGEIPSKITPSNPAHLSAGPKKPPELACPHSPVCGDLATTEEREALADAGPVGGPG